MGLLLMAAAAAQAAAPHVPVVVQPDYRLKPTMVGVLHFYPRAAARKSLPGKATSDCVGNLKGSLTDCTVFSEDPVGEGFGVAAVRMSSIFKMWPMTVDGVPTGGGKVRISVQFRA